MKKRLLSMLMAVLMIASLVPATALAANATLDPVINIEADAAAKQPGIKVTPTSEAYNDYTVVITPFTKQADRCDKHTPVTKGLITASCEQAGLTVAYCSVCGVKTAEPVVTPKLAHDWEFKVVVAPTCKVNDGWGYAVCKKCGNPVAVDASTDFEAFVEKGATESKDAYAKRVAAVKELFTADEKHDFQTVTANIMKKDANGKETKEVDAYAGVEATHIAMLVEGNKTYNLTWQWKDGGYISARDAAGYAKLVADGKVIAVTGNKVEAGVACTKCDTVKTKGGEVADTNLNLEHAKYITVTDPGKRPVYFDPAQGGDGSYKDGKTATYWCSKCGKSFGGDVISAVKWFNITETAMPKIGDVKIYEGEIVYKLDADGKNVVMINPADLNKAVAATCCKEGNTGDVIVYTASGAADKDGNIPAVWMLKEVGKKLDKIDHNYVAKPDKLANCKNGDPGEHYVGVYICNNVVGKNDDGTPIYCYESNRMEGTKYDVITYTTQIPAAHTPTVVVLVEATCQHKGLSVLQCSVCKEYLVARENQGVTTYITADQGENPAYTVEKAKHTAAAELKDAKEATCTEVGYTGDKVCKWCGIVMEKGKEIPMKEHTVVDVAAVEATCTEAGATAGTKCSVCGTVLSGCEKIDALGHKYENGVCTVCGEKDPNYKPEVKNPFTDVKEGDAFYEDILWAADKNIVDGIKADDGTMTFQANGKLTRAQVVQMLWNANGKPEAKAAADFSDVAADAWYAKAVAWAVEAGVINGMGDGTFAPNAECTRAQFVKMLWVINGSPKADAADFSDVAADAWYAQAVAWAAAQEVTLGDGEGHFLPGDSCTRGQAVAFLHRAPSLTVTAAE